MMTDDLYDELERYRKGYQGSCYACEPVGILNQQLRAENSHLHHQTNKLGEDVLRLRAEVASLRKLWEEERNSSDWLEKDNEMLRGLYNELIMSVGNKYEGETRHQTALRYIKRAEEVEVFEGSEKAALGGEGKQ